MEWRIGEVARRTGLTVRTMHHWEAVGLVRPARRTAAGYRVYGPAELERLLRILALRQLGLPLDEIRESLDRPESSFQGVLARQIARLDAAIAAQRRLRDRLHLVADRAMDGVSAEALMEIMEEMTMFEKHFTREQLETLAERREQLGEERIRQVEAEWPELIAAVRAEMERGTDPSSPRMGELARRWKELLAVFTGGDAGLTQGLTSVLREEPAARQRTGLDPDIIAYVARAWDQATRA